MDNQDKTISQQVIGLIQDFVEEYQFLLSIAGVSISICLGVVLYMLVFDIGDTLMDKLCIVVSISALTCLLILSYGITSFFILSEKDVCTKEHGKCKANTIIKTNNPYHFVVSLMFHYIQLYLNTLIGATVLFFVAYILQIIVWFIVQMTCNPEDNGKLAVNISNKIKNILNVKVLFQFVRYPLFHLIVFLVGLSFIILSSLLVVDISKSAKDDKSVTYDRINLTFKIAFCIIISCYYLFMVLKLVG